MLENNIKNLIKILEDSKVDELEISTFWGKQKIKIRKKSVQSSENNIEPTHPDSSPPIINAPDINCISRITSLLTFITVDPS